VRLLLTRPGIPFEPVEYDINEGHTHTPGFLEKVNDNDRVPVFETEDENRTSGTIKFGPGRLSRVCSSA
jgi:glutathione S-transferase